MKQAGISVRTSYHECSPSKCSQIAKSFRYAEVRYSPIKKSTAETTRGSTLNSGFMSH